MRFAPVFGIFSVIAFCLPARVFSIGDVLFRPPVANPFEGRVGTMVQFGEKKLRLDVGNTIDLVTFSPADSVKCSAGADFFTFTRLRSEGNFKFPVETSDYYFGLNGAVILSENNGWTFGGRLRYAHISSHLVDGLADSAGRFVGQLPFVYSREFFDVLASAGHGAFRVYAGIIYVYARQPRTAEPLIPQAGFDVRHTISESFDLLAGYDVKLIGIERIYSAMHAAQAGILYKTSRNRGVSLNLYVFSGRSMHGMFFREHDSYISSGFQIHF